MQFDTNKKQCKSKQSTCLHAHQVLILRRLARGKAHSRKSHPVPRSPKPCDECATIHTNASPAIACCGTLLIAILVSTCCTCGRFEHITIHVCSMTDGNTQYPHQNLKAPNKCNHHKLPRTEQRYNSEPCSFRTRQSLHCRLQDNNL